MRSDQSEAWLSLPLLPIFAIGIIPALLFALLGYIGIVLPGLLMICAGLSVALQANSAFNEQVIIHGYARRSEQAVHAASLRSANRFACSAIIAGAALIVVAICGYFCFG